MQLSWVYHIACHWGVDMQLCSSSHEGKSCELQVYCFLSSVCSNAILLSYTEEYFQLILWPSDWAYFTIAKCPSSKQLVWQLCFWSAAFRIHITFLQTWCYYLQAAHGVQSLSLLMWAGCCFFYRVTEASNPHQWAVYRIWRSRLKELFDRFVLAF